MSLFRPSRRPRSVGLLALATSLALAGGLLPGPVAAAPPLDLFCTGMSAPGRTDPDNRAPVAVDDTATVVGGGSVTIPVLANDSDPDGDELRVVSITQPSRGESCVHGDGTVELFSVASRHDHTVTFRYGVTDGERYRTAQVSVAVAGTDLVRAEVVTRLRTRGEKVVRPAKVAFRNTNGHPVVVLAGRPSADRPSVRRRVPAGGSVTVRTRIPRLVYVAVLLPRGQEASLLNLGRVDTRTGRVRTSTLDAAGLRTRPAGSAWTAAR